MNEFYEIRREQGKAEYNLGFAGSDLRELAEAQYTFYSQEVTEIWVRKEGQEPRPLHPNELPFDPPHVHAERVAQIQECKQALRDHLSAISEQEAQRRRDQLHAIGFIER